MPDDSTPVQISRLGKFTAGIFLIGATVFAITTLLAYWPNKMPAPGKGDDAWYTSTRYKITLIENNKTGAEPAKGGKPTVPVADSLNKVRDSLNKSMKLKTVAKDADGVKKDSEELVKVNDAIAKQPTVKAGEVKPDVKPTAEANTSTTETDEVIHLNTLLLILVATMGFLGNMIHIAASFTSFVGNDTFKKSWVMWYFVKPFTASALAIIVYFVIRAGFIGYGSDPSGISLYGVLCLAALAGLFTDNATLKLKEIFDVIFKPKDERGDKLDDFRITSIKPDKIDVNNLNKIKINGKNFDKIKLVIKMNDAIISNAAITATTIEFDYTVGVADRNKTSFDLLITDEAGKELVKKTLGV